ncbi:hypothetical protein WN51_05549 [Melipona quadrifasciata]|uniref:Uncharacterized protein n=1 Tax=Melipona quadrifasciata TaxID=166423 RepID=A0A0M8ZT12_9HYME|nr:hypothetical protein WN51_05549 [Melipona quadrifasciata]
MLAFKCQLTPLDDDVCIKAVPCCDCEKTISANQHKNGVHFQNCFKLFKPTESWLNESHYGVNERICRGFKPTFSHKFHLFRTTNTPLKRVTVNKLNRLWRTASKFPNCPQPPTRKRVRNIKQTAGEYFPAILAGKRMTRKLEALSGSTSRLFESNRRSQEV